MAACVENECYEDETELTWFPLIINATMSSFMYIMTLKLLPKLKEMFIKANLFGIDMSKTTSEKV